MCFFHALQVEPGFMFGFLDSSIESLELLKEEDVNGIISRVELIEKLRVKKAQATISAKVTTVVPGDLASILDIFPDSRERCRCLVRQ